MITHTTKRKVALFLREMFGSTYGETKLGTGGGGTNPTATDLDVPIITSTSKNNSTSSDDKVIEIKNSFTGSSLQGYTVREVGFFGSLPTDAEMADIDVTADYDITTSGNRETVMLGRVNFDAIGNFSTSDTIEIIYTMEVE